MSSRVTYLGCYFHLPKVNKLKTRKKKICSNESCVNHQVKNTLDSRARFCPQCGQAIVEKSFNEEIIEYLRTYDIEQKAKEEMSKVDWVDAFVMADPENYKGVVYSNFSTYIKDMDSVESPVDFSELNIEQEKKKFEEMLDKKGFRKFLKDYYNIDVEVKYGLITYEW